MNELFLYGFYVFGLIMVVIFSIKEFNAPKYRYDTDSDGDGKNKTSYAKLASPTLPKYMADKSRYTVFMIAFVAFAGLLYLMLAYILYILPIGFLPVEYKKAMVAILSMLLLIGLVKADEVAVMKGLVFIKWPRTLLFGLIKDWLHSFAYIPCLSCDIFSTLCYEQIDRESAVVKKNIDKILLKEYLTDIQIKDYIERNDFLNVANSSSMIARWARLSYFIFVVDEWKENLKFKNQVTERSLKLGKLKKEYKTLIGPLVNYRDKNVVMSQDEEQILSDQIDHLLANCYRLISCVVIMTAKASEDPLRYIKDIGMKVNPRGQVFTRHGELFRILFAMVPTIIVLALLYTVFDPADPRVTIQKIILYIASAFFIMILPIILVSGLKRQMAISKTWKVVTIDTSYQSFFEMPLWTYTMVSSISWTISLLFMMVFIHKKDVTTVGSEGWVSMLIFCFISFITAFIACYRSDIPQKVYKNWVYLFLSILGLSSLHGCLTALTVWVGLIMSNASGNAMWEFPLLGFFVSMALGCTLFYGKHKIERRGSHNREACNEPVIVIQGKNQFPAIILNKSPTGVMLFLNQARSLIKENKMIEIKFKNGLEKIGFIKRMDLQKLNVAYQ